MSGAGADSPAVGKAQLAAALGWARTRLDRHLQSDAAFPVLRRGGKSGGWQFDVDQVRKHLGLKAPVPTPRELIGKKELCRLLGWARTKLDLRLKTDPLFPCECHGNQSGGWKFDPARVRAYLAGESVSSPAAIDSAQLRDTVKLALPPEAEQTAFQVPAAAPRRTAHHKGEATARQRKDAVQAELLELKLGVERGKYVPSDYHRQTLTTFVMTVVTALENLPNNIVRQLSLPEMAAPMIQQWIDDLRKSLHGQLQTALDSQPLATTEQEQPT